MGARSIRVFIGDAIAAVPDALSGFDLLVGLHIRKTLHVLRLDPDRWRLVDLRPPQKSRRLNRRGRTLKITPELLIWGTTGIARPLGDPENVARYLARGEAGKLARRLESDVKLESPLVGLCGQYSNFLRPDLVPRLRQLLAQGILGRAANTDLGLLLRPDQVPRTPARPIGLQLLRE